MHPESISLFSLISKRMSWLAQRQTVLSDNIANADTPGYEARDLKAFNFRKVLHASSSPAAPMRQTSALHLSGTRLERSDAARAEVEKKPYETTISGNAVVLEEQMVKVSETQSAYQLTTNLYRKQLDMLRSALGRL